ncbi:hypothetical protein EV126DRAFT_419746 [Verticillium dahliae]|nr:hypothetical protein EV126DRAFT_419746 [Verticillium dahliae]
MTNPFRAGSSGLHQIEHHRHSLQSSRQQAGCCHLPFVSAIRLWQPSSRRQPLGFQLLPSTWLQARRLSEFTNRSIKHPSFCNKLPYKYSTSVEVRSQFRSHHVLIQRYQYGPRTQCRHQRGLFDVSNHDTTRLKHAYAAFRDVQKPAFIFGKDALSTRVNPLESDVERVELAEFLVPRNLGIAPMYHLVELVLAIEEVDLYDNLNLVVLKRYPVSLLCRGDLEPIYGQWFEEIFDRFQVPICPESTQLQKHTLAAS